MAIEIVSESHLYMYECTFSPTKGIKSPADFPLICVSYLETGEPGWDEGED
jgi:hypothetical protein